MPQVANTNSNINPQTSNENTNIADNGFYKMPEFKSQTTYTDSYLPTVTRNSKDSIDSKYVNSHFDINKKSNKKFLKKKIIPGAYKVEVPT